MIVFGCAITRPEEFDAYAKPGIEAARESDSEILTVSSEGTIFRAYNDLMEHARQFEEIEALVLVHQDTEIVSSGFCAIVREALSNPNVAIVGCVGAIGVRSIAWWEGAITTASFSHRYDEMGGGQIDGFSWDPREAAPYARYGDVETVDGFILVLSPWAVNALRFDESLGRIHGYDLDICLQAREAGRKVVTADFRAIHHRSLWPISDPDDWAQANVRVVKKWEGRAEGIGAGAGTWRERALRAEAGADAARLTGYLLDSEREAIVKKLQADIQETVESVSWRLAGPITRSVNRRPPESGKDPNR